MKIPKDWNEITVEQFQDCYFLLGKAPDTDNWVMVISRLTGKTINQVETLPITELKKIILKLKFLSKTDSLTSKVNKFIYIKGWPYKADLFAQGMQMNQVADLKGLMYKEGQSNEDTVIENLHKLLACVYLPLSVKGFKYRPGKHAKLSQGFKKVKIGSVYGALFFYSSVYESLMECINTYGQEQGLILESHLKEVQLWAKKNLEPNGVGNVQ